MSSLDLTITKMEVTIIPPTSITGRVSIIKMGVVVVTTNTTITKINTIIIEVGKTGSKRSHQLLSPQVCFTIKQKTSHRCTNSLKLLKSSPILALKLHAIYHYVQVGSTYHDRLTNSPIWPRDVIPLPLFVPKLMKHMHTN